MFKTDLLYCMKRLDVPSVFIDDSVNLAFMCCRLTLRDGVDTFLLNLIEELKNEICNLRNDFRRFSIFDERDHHRVIVRFIFDNLNLMAKIYRVVTSCYTHAQRIIARAYLKNARLPSFISNFITDYYL